MMGEKNGNGNGGSELTQAISAFESAAREVKNLEAEIAAMKNRLAQAMGRGKVAAAKVKELLNLVGKKKTASGEPRKTAKRGEKPSIALRLLLSDGGPYHTTTFAEEFGGTVGAAYQVLKKLRDQGYLTQPKEAHWALSERGEAYARSLPE